MIKLYLDRRAQSHPNFRISWTVEWNFGFGKPSHWNLNFFPHSSDIFTHSHKIIQNYRIFALLKMPSSWELPLSSLALKATRNIRNLKIIKLLSQYSVIIKIKLQFYGVKMRDNNESTTPTLPFINQNSRKFGLKIVKFHFEFNFAKWNYLLYLNITWWLTIEFIIFDAELPVN